MFRACTASKTEPPIKNHPRFLFLPRGFCCSPTPSSIGPTPVPRSSLTARIARREIHSLPETRPAEALLLLLLLRKTNVYQPRQPTRNRDNTFDPSICSIAYEKENNVRNNYTCFVNRDDFIGERLQMSNTILKEGH